MPSAMSEPSVSRIGKYRILSLFKTGGMALIYKAEDPDTGLLVALKVLSAESASQPKRLERFRREARQGARLRHENIVTLYDSGEIDGTLFLAMEFIDGIDVEQLIREHGPLDAEDTRIILTQVARALDYAHEMGVVHRDIKPSNILLTQRNGRCLVKVADLGLARGGIDEESRVTADGSTVGTVDYMAPEQAKDSGQADVRSDLYALGCSMYHMLSGAPPFAEGSIVERLVKHAKTEPPDLRVLNPQVPDDLWAVCRRLLAKKPSQRYQTPAELMTDLAQSAPHAGAASRVTKLDAYTTKLSLQNAPQPEAPPSEQDAYAIPVPSDDRPLSSEDGRRVAEAQFEHATHAIATGNYDYGIHLLLNCCRLEPGSLAYQQALHRAQVARHAAPGVRPWCSLPMRWLYRFWLKAAAPMQHPQRALACARQLLTYDPYDLAVQLDMADAARSAGYTELSVWLLETALAAHSDDPRACRTLAELLEEQGEIGRARELWERIALQVPSDSDVAKKVRDLSASEMTGKYRKSGKTPR